MNKKCPCNSGSDFAACCKPFILEKISPSTPEQLMRSRYTAYSQANMNYIVKTMQGKPLVNFNAKNSETWAKSVEWLGLKVLHTEMQKPKGFIEFIAHFSENGKREMLHEKSEFIFEDDKWFYIDGIAPKIGRNDLCSCGSGKKFKKCCE